MLSILAIGLALVAVVLLCRYETAQMRLRRCLMVAGYISGRQGGGVAAFWRLAGFGCGVGLVVAGVWSVGRVYSWRSVVQARPVVLIVLDTSASMRASSGPTTRLQRGVQACQDLSEAMPQADFGLITFGGEAWLDFPPSPDRRGWHDALAHAATVMPDEQGSHPGSALDLARRVLLAYSAHPRVVLLCTDGEINVPIPNSADDAWNRRDFPCLLVLPGVDGETAAVPLPGITAETRIDSGMIRSRLEQVSFPYQIRPLAGSATVLSGVVARLLPEGSLSSSGSVALALRTGRLLLCSGCLALLLFLALQRWRGVVLLLLLLPLAGISGKRDDLYRRAYDLCRQAETDSALWPEARTAARAAVREGVARPEAAVLLEYILTRQPVLDANSTDESSGESTEVTRGGMTGAGQPRVVADEATVEAETSSDASVSVGGYPWRCLEGRRPAVRKPRPACHPW